MLSGRKLHYLVLSIVLFGLSGCGSKAGEKIFRIAVIEGHPPFAQVTKGFTDKMEELGYGEGKKISYIVYRAVPGSSEEKAALEDLAEKDVDLVFAFPTGTAIAAKTLADKKRIPLVFAIAVIENTGLADSARNPGGLASGVQVPGPEVVVKRLEYLRELKPSISRVYIAYNPRYPTNAPARVRLADAARLLGVELIDEPAESLEALRGNLERVPRSGPAKPDAVLVMPDDLTQTRGWPLLSRFAGELGIPVCGGAPGHAETGAVISLYSDFYKSGGLAAVIADRVLEGTPVGTIPVVTAVLSLRVNHTLARSLGLEVPESLLNVAAEILRDGK